MKTSIEIPLAGLKNILTGLGKVAPKRPRLPVPQRVKVTRDREGHVTMTTTDLDTYLTANLPDTEAGDPFTILISFTALKQCVDKAGKTGCVIVRTDDTINAILETPVGEWHREPVISADEWPGAPCLDGDAVALPEGLKANILAGFSFASDDPARQILNGVFVDVTEPTNHHVVACNGRVLFTSNSFTINAQESFIVPTHPFVAWKEFAKDGEWSVRSRAASKGSDRPLIQVRSQNWVFTSHQPEGTYPNWRQIMPDKDGWKTRLFVYPAQLSLLVAGLPDNDVLNHGVGLAISKNQAVPSLGDVTTLVQPSDRSYDKIATPAKEGVGRVEGDAPEHPYWLNRKYLLAALALDCDRLHITDENSPIWFTDDGHRRRVVVSLLRVL